MEQEKRIILDFLKTNTLATISTVDNKTLRPESALIAFAETAELEIIFITSERSRKYNNLRENSQVAFVIGWHPDPKNWVTLQYEGNAIPIEENEYAKYRRLFFKKENTPCTADFLLNPTMKFFKVNPTWIGYSDFTNEKPYVIEITSGH